MGMVPRFVDTEAPMQTQISVSSQSRAALTDGLGRRDEAAKNAQVLMEGGNK